MRPGRLLWSLCLLLAFAGGVRAQSAVQMTSRYFVTSDGVRLHYLEAGPANAHTIVLVPGWTMPGWIWLPQIEAFAARYHVVAFDPRGQGLSDVPVAGYEPNRRGQDIAELVATQGAQVLLVGWSLGVLDALAYVHTHGDAHIAGLVLVDNSIGEDPAPVPRRGAPNRGPPLPRDEQMARFVRSMFHRPQSEQYLDNLTEATLRTPEYAARALLAYPVPRTYWREAVYSTGKPVFYAVRPAFAAQAANLQQRHPAAETAVFADAGHALFIDQASRFDQLLESFIRRRVWP